MMIWNIKRSCILLAAGVILIMGGCTKKNITEQTGAITPDTSIKDNIVIDWNQVAMDVEEIFDNKEEYPLGEGAKFMDVQEGATKLNLYWLVSDDTTPEEAVEYATAFAKGFNDITVTQDFSIASSTATTYGGLFDKYDMNMQIIPISYVGEDSYYLVDQDIAAGSNTPMQSKQ